MQRPLFSIVIASYNQKPFVGDAVTSALQQTYKDKEVIVVDDCSSDGTASILTSFGSSICFSPLLRNSGVAAARNHGASLARGQYVAFLDGDDVMLPWALEAYASIIAARQPSIILGRSHKFYGTGDPVIAGAPPADVDFVEYPTFLAKDRPWVYNTSCLVVERSAFCAAKGWSCDLFYQDIQDLLNKLGIAGKTVLVLNPDTVYYRLHGTNAVSKVAPFINGIDTLVKKARVGMYPGGWKHRLQRSAWFGGLSFYWAKRALASGMYRDGFRLLCSRWWMIALATVRRCAVLVAGRNRIQTLSLNHE